MVDVRCNNPEVDAYIASFPENTQVQLNRMRTIIHRAAPLAEEVISYKMPAYKYRGILVYFAGYEKHIGFYPTGSSIEHFKNEFTGFKFSKGAVQFPIDTPLPENLIERIVAFRVKENELK